MTAGPAAPPPAPDQPGPGAQPDHEIELLEDDPAVAPRPEEEAADATRLPDPPAR
jgi:hypothetical protein